MELPEEQDKQKDKNRLLAEMDPFLFFTIMMGVLTVKSDHKDELEE